jgi:hypothetical protein
VLDRADQVGCFDSYFTRMNERVQFVNDKNVAVVRDVLLELHAVFSCELFAIQQPFNIITIAIFKESNFYLNKNFDKE